MDSASRPRNSGTKGKNTRYVMSYEHSKYFLTFVKEINPQGASAWELLRDRFTLWLKTVAPAQ